MTHEIMNRILTDKFDDIMQNLFICNEILHYGGSVVHAGLVVATGVTLGSSQRSGHARLCQGDCRGGRAVECVAGAAASDASLAVKETDVFEPSACPRGVLSLKNSGNRQHDMAEKRTRRRLTAALKRRLDCSVRAEKP